MPKNGERLDSTEYYLIIGDLSVNCVRWIDLEDETGLYKLYEKGYLIDKKGYVDIQTETVWIYQETKPHALHRYPYLWYDAEHRCVAHNHPGDHILAEASFSRARKRELDDIIRAAVSEDAVPNRKMEKLSREGAEMILPVIKLKDDHLKKQIKAIIRKKHRSLRNLPPLAGQNHLTSNMKQALVTDTKMSTPYHIGWADMLGYDFVHFSFDNGKDTDYPLLEAVIYDSRTDMISYLPMEKMQEILEIVNNFAQEDQVLKAKITGYEDDSEEDNIEVLDPENPDEDEEEPI